MIMASTCPADQIFRELKIMRKKFIYLTFTSFLIAGCDYINPPKTVDDCLLKNLKPGLSDRVVEMLEEACSSKFRKLQVEPENNIKDLDQKNLEKITGRAGLEASGYFKGKVHNGNSGWEIREISILLKSKNKDAPRVYVTKLNIKPFSSGDILFDAGSEYGDVDWTIIAARGVRSK